MNMHLFGQEMFMFRSSQIEGSTRELKQIEGSTRELKMTST